MNFCIKIYVFITSVIFSSLALCLLMVYFDSSFLIPSLISLERKCFGDHKACLDSNKGKSNSMKPYHINVSHDVIDDLKQRLQLDLNRAKSFEFPKSIIDSFEYGTNVEFLTSEIGQYWLNDYNWTKQENMLNQMGNHFHINMDGIDLHYLHVKPKTGTNDVIVLPMLIIHGWPGSFVEFKDIVPLLTQARGGRKFVFELIIPSIPGYGFSSTPKTSGFHIGHCAR